jgi:GNAT superfamily N-acetyltransferase
MLRLALERDFPAMHSLRMSVRENILSDPASVRIEDYRDILAGGGRGWAWEEDGAVRGFAIVDMGQANIWALFVAPGFEGRGIGRALHDAMLDWAFAQGTPRLWLSTGAATRAQALYERAGWERAGTEANGDLRYEMPREAWIARAR